MYPFDRAFLRVPVPAVRLRGRCFGSGWHSLEDAVFCPCCKGRIRFSDDRASGHRTRRSVHNALTDLEREIKNLDTTITITI